MKSAEAYKGSAVGWLQSKVPDNFVKAKDAYQQRILEAFQSFKVDDAIAFAKTTSVKGYVLVTQVCLLRSSCAHTCPSFRVHSCGLTGVSCRRR